MTFETNNLSNTRRSGKSASAFRTISEVSEDLEVPPHVLRFWETKFPQIKPLKRGGGRRYYRPEDILMLRQIREFLYSDGYTIKGVQKLLRDGGIKQPLDIEEPVPVASEASKTTLDSSMSDSDRGELEAILEELVSLKKRLSPLIDK